MNTVPYVSIMEAAAFDDTAIILRAARTPDGKGGERTTYNQIASYPCNLQQNQQPTERQIAEKNTEESGWLVFLPHDAVVSRKDRIQIGSSLFDVMGVNTGESNRILTQATCRRVS